MDSETPKADAVERGCGRRTEGGAYFETGLAPDRTGKELEHFMADPPTPWDVDSHIGQELIQRNGTWHVVDWIGEEHYPWPADFLEEVRRHGLSRKTSRHFDFDKLTPESRILCVHAKALPATAEGAETLTVFEHGANLLTNQHHRLRCAHLFRTGDTDHVGPNDRSEQRDDPLWTTACNRWWWLAPPADSDAYKVGATRTVVEDVTEYEVVGGPDGQGDMIEWEPGIIASFPITRMACIASADGSHTDRQAEVQEQIHSAIPVEVAPE